MFRPADQPAPERSRHRRHIFGLKCALRRATAGSWWLSKLWYSLHGLRIRGGPSDPVWYVACGANMHDGALRERRGMQPLEWRPGRIKGYRLRCNLEGRPIGKAAPANISPAPDTEVWGVLYENTRRGAVQLDATEGVPGRRYRPLWLEAEDIDGNRITPTFTYIAEGKPVDGRPSLRYLTLLRDGACARHLPEHWLRFFGRRSTCKMTATCRQHEPAWSAAVIDAAPGGQTDRLLIDEGKAFFISTGCDADASVVEVLSGLIRGALADMLAAR